MRLRLSRLQLERRPRSRDRCGSRDCRGLLHVYHTHVEGESRIRYLECEICGWKPADNKQVVPLELAPPRPRRAG
jgi:hypothetical protein